MLTSVRWEIVEMCLKMLCLWYKVFVLLAYFCFVKFYRTGKKYSPIAITHHMFCVIVKWKIRLFPFLPILCGKYERLNSAFAFIREYGGITGVMSKFNFFEFVKFMRFLKRFVFVQLKCVPHWCLQGLMRFIPTFLLNTVSNVWRSW